MRRFKEAQQSALSGARRRDGTTVHVLVVGWLARMVVGGEAVSETGGGMGGRRDDDGVRYGAVQRQEAPEQLVDPTEQAS